MIFMFVTGMDSIQSNLIDGFKIFTIYYIGTYGIQLSQILFQRKQVEKLAPWFIKPRRDTLPDSLSQEPYL